MDVFSWVLKKYALYSFTYWIRELSLRKRIALHLATDVIIPQFVAPSLGGADSGPDDWIEE